MEHYPFQPRDENGPVFNEPWEAQAFALVIALHERGAFSWPEWAEALSREIAAVQAAGDPDLGDSYYQHWLAALEALTQQKRLSSADELSQRKSLWHSAYLNTPHGKPIELASAVVPADAAPTNAGEGNL